MFEPVDEVYLSLGANTMLAYPLNEALELLKNKIQSAKLKLAEATEEEVFLRNQITTSQVNIARVFNWDVKRRKEQRSKQQQVDPQ
ncbi:hypothetical protein O181_050738 [Austropuccinia psidii MF-1]|uniref:Prefoldin subunit 3 n=1 Tax=Austropuccinia psidii MF-1 TaxID=1389203 RepID=A0A9Q3DZN3_9BASI|nr:hypothetical protein [Austropuccinia psidii MF-1]